MALRTCHNCGNTIRVQGLAAICPHCGQLVSVAEEEVVEIDPVSAAEQEFAPRPLPREFLQPTPSRSSRQIWWIVGASLLTVIVFTTLLIILTRPSKPLAVAPAVAPHTPTPRTVAPEPKGSEWFSETPLAPAQPAVAPETPEPPPATLPTAPKRPHSELANLKPLPPSAELGELTDERVGAAIARGVEFLLNQFSKTRLKNADAYDPDTFAGLNALAVYALLHSGQALGDARLGVQSELVKELLDRLKEYAMDGQRATYSRSLRISALAVHNRPEDRAAMEADLKWLIQASMKGAYHYSMPPPDATRDSHGWDNSNSQYGALGVWAAANAGLKVSANYWIDVEQHWQWSQTHSGGWGYSSGSQSATLSMTAAGANMLFVARDQMALDSPPTQAYIPLTKAQQRALEWLDEGDNAINLDGGHRGYTLYGLERAGLACGYKYFGKHDWYRELAARTLREQQPDGSWTGGDGIVAETAFSLLFLSRGRHPIFVAKLKYDGAWSNRPRDLQVLTRFASRQLERPLNWQVADIGRSFNEWSDSPLLLITSDRPPKFSEAEIAKLRGFVLAGGLILTQTERESAPFNQFAADLAQELFPDLPFEPIDPSHEVYSIVYPMAAHLPLKGVSNGARLLMIHSPTDLGRYWQPFPGKSQKHYSELTINIGVYAAGRRDLRNRLSSAYVPEPSRPAVGAVPLARLKYQGPWDPEPEAWSRAARLLQHQTGIALNLVPTELAELKFETAPVAHLTGTRAVALTDAQADALRRFITRGGVLLIDACGGSKAFAESIETNVLPRLFLDSTPATISSEHPLLRGGEGMADLRKARLRPTIRPGAETQLLVVRAGAGQILFSRLDVTSGLLGTHTAGIRGYDPGYCQDLVRNLTLWTIQRMR